MRGFGTGFGPKAGVDVLLDGLEAVVQGDGLVCERLAVGLELADVQDGLLDHDRLADAPRAGVREDALEVLKALVDLLAPLVLREHMDLPLVLLLLRLGPAGTRDQAKDRGRLRTG